MANDAEAAPPNDNAQEFLDADGRHRPRFVLDFPNDPELRELVALFERGDFRSLRVRAPELAARTTDPVVKAACQELSQRIRPDRTVVTLLALSLAFFCFLVAWAYLH